MAITYQGSAGITTAAAGFNITSASASPVDGDIRLVILQVGSSVTVTVPSGWTTILNDTTYASTRVVSFYRKYVAATDSATVSCTYNTSSNQVVTFINLGNQVDTAGTFVWVNNGGTSGTSFASPSLTPSTANGMLITTFHEAVTGGASGVTLSTPAGMSSMGQKIPTGTQTRTALSTYLNLTSAAATSTYTSTSNTTGTTGWTGTSIFVPAINTTTPVTTTDSATTTDTSLLTSTTPTTDTATTSESSGINVKTTDTGTVTDSSALYINKSLSTSDSATVTDTSSLFTPTQINVSDSATLTDASLPINQNTQAVGSETFTLTDSSSVTSTEGPTETGTVSDSSNLLVTQSKTDSATVTESSKINVITSDSATLSNTAQIGQQRTDSAIVTDLSSPVGHPQTDSATATESSQIAQSVTDSATVSDTSSLFVTQDLIDSATVTDLTTGITKPVILQDGPFQFSEQAEVQELPRYTEDVIHYTSADTHNKNFRIIAQDHFTREFIHWDLPLDGVQITYTFNGYNTLVGVITSEMASVMDLDPPLIPNRTWLHVEQDGIIRGSFILTPFIDSPGNQTRQIEAEGFTAYPNWIIYQGHGDPASGYVGIQVDPADMVRKIWNEVQSYTDGNLGVRVSATKTPVKIGEPPEQVSFTTSEGNQVSFQAGPYTLNWWAVTNCGDEITKLCQEAPLDYIEFSKWNDNKTDVEHTCILGYPRIGSKRTDLGFREGENLETLIPSYQGSNDNYASDVIVVGAGTGPSAVRATASGRIGLLRKTNVIQNQDISNHARAQSIANFEFKRISHSRFLIENISIDCTHENALWGSFNAGDDILVEGTVDYVGFIQDWYRIMNYAYDPYYKVATLVLEPSDSFTYGAENVDPYDELPTSGYARLLATQDFTQLFDGTETTTDADSLAAQALAFVTQDAQSYLCSLFNTKGLGNGQCYYWYLVGGTKQWYGVTIPMWSPGKGPLTDLSLTKNTMVIGKTDYGHIITGDNIQLLSSDGTVGQDQNTTSVTAYPNPPVTASVTKSNSVNFGIYQITDTDQSTYAKQIIFKARQDGLKQFLSPGITLGQALFIRTANDGSMSLLLGTLASMVVGDLLVIEKDNSGTVQVGPGILINQSGQSLTGLQQAAQAVYDRIHSGLSITSNWTWTGEPLIVDNYVDQLQELFYGYSNITVDQFLSAVIEGQVA